MSSDLTLPFDEKKIIRTPPASCCMLSTQKNIKPLFYCAAASNLPKCMSLKPLSPAEEKIILMESGGEDLRRLRQMKPLLAATSSEPLQHQKEAAGMADEADKEGAQETVLAAHKRKRHKAHRLDNK